MSQESARSNTGERESLLINNENNNIITSSTLEEAILQRSQSLSHFKSCQKFIIKHSKWFILMFILITLYCIVIYILTLIGMAELVRFMRLIAI